MRFLLAAVLTLCLASPSLAARLMTTGFEENNAGSSCCWDVATGTAVTYSTTNPHSGTYKALTGSGATGSYLRRTNTAVTSGSTYARFYFSTSSAAPSADTIFFQDLNSSLTAIMTLKELTTGAIKLTNTITSTTVTSSTILTADTWYRIETEHTLSDTVGSMTLRLYVGDSTTITETLAITNEDTLTTNVGAHWLGKFDAIAVAFSYDDFVLNSSAGSAPTTWPGPGKTYLLVPDSNVTMTWETTAGTGTDDATFANINEFPGARDDTKYNVGSDAATPTDAIGDIDRLGLTNLGAEVTSNATITYFDVYGIIGSSQTAATHMRFKVWDEGGTLASGPTMNANVTTWRLPSDNEHQVYDATGKTKANLDSFNVGYEILTDTITGRPRRISTLWVNVEWIEAATSAGTLPSSQGFLGVILPGVTLR